MGLASVLTALAACSLLAHASSLFIKPGQSGYNSAVQDNQSLVTWDKHSFMVRGERLFVFSGEFHPFRLPVPGLWLDVFQKIKAMGFNCVSFYTDWGLLEGNPGHVVTSGIWSLDELFSAAAEAGIYLLARPSPYINAETAAGGMPGWTLRVNSTLRSEAFDYTNATKLYLSTLGKIIADAQITNGEPVVLVQPENEYSTWPNLNATQFPEQFDREYMAFVEQQLWDAGIVVPFIDNDNEALGYWAPGTSLGSVDIDGKQTSPNTPLAIPEFQGGSGTGWGPNSVDQDGCNALVNEESVRILYKNNYSFGVKLLNIYMTYGGTNWGNLGYEGGDRSYEYGAAIAEDRHVWREKYSEEKLEANFLKASPAYLTATPGNASNGSYVSTDDIATTPIFRSDYPTNFYIVRHADFTSLANTTYQLFVTTNADNITILHLGGQVSLNDRDSKIHVTDHDVGSVNLVYCTRDVFTWAEDEQVRRVLIMYGGAGETHEYAVPKHLGRPRTVGSPAVKTALVGSTWVVQWTVTAARQIVVFPYIQLEVHMLWRNGAHSHWVLELLAAEPIGNYSSPSKSNVIVKGGYLLRTASIFDNELMLTGDINITTDFELIHEPTGIVRSILLNGNPLKSTRSSDGKLCASVPFVARSVLVPDLSP